MAGWHHRLNGQEFEQAPGDSEGRGGLGCCSPRGRRESDRTEPVNQTELIDVWSYTPPAGSEGLADLSALVM